MLTALLYLHLSNLSLQLLYFFVRHLKLLEDVRLGEIVKRKSINIDGFKGAHIETSWGVS